jgi:hypothetical protein
LSRSVTSRRGASVLPHDGVGQGAARGALPEQRGLALVGDADGRHVRAAQPGGGERPGGDVALAGPDLLGVVLDPARSWEDLAEFLLCHRQDSAVGTEGHGARARGALVEGEDGLHVVAAGSLMARPIIS